MLFNCSFCHINPPCVILGPENRHQLTPTGSRWVCSCFARSLLLLKALLQLLWAANLHRNGFSPVCDLCSVVSVQQDCFIEVHLIVRLTDCGFSGSRGAQKNGCSHLPENHNYGDGDDGRVKSWFEKVTLATEMSSLGGAFRLQEKPWGQISMDSPTWGAAPLNPFDNLHA